jgi:hypothetical protein
LGDFNAVDEIDDRESSKTTPPKIRLALLEPLRDLVKVLSLTDVWSEIRKKINLVGRTIVRLARLD